MESTFKQKKILILVDWFYPGYKAGGPIQSCRNFIGAMDNQFIISVVTSDRDLGDTVPYPTIQAGQWNNYTAHTDVFYTAGLSIKQVRELQEEKQADYIYLNSMFSLRYTIYPLYLLWRNKLNGKIIVAPRGMLQKGAMQFRSIKKKLFLTAIKLLGIHKRITFHATDDQEQTDIRSFFPDAGKVVVATNFPKMEQPSFVGSEKKAGTLNCIFISRIVPKKNLAYLLSALSKVSSSMKISLDIRGEAEDKNYLQSCMDIVALLPPNIRVVFNGPIENDKIPGLIQQQQLFVLPTMGENFGHAIFEAMAAGRPVLVSDQTPWIELTGRKAGWDLPLNDPAAFTKIIEEVAAMTTEEFLPWCQGAWQLANDFIQHTDIKQQYLKLFN